MLSGEKLHKRKALIIEDNEMNREMLSEIIRTEFDCFFAENGKVGLELLKKYYRELSIIFLDVVMPVMDGYTFLEIVQQDSLLSTIPVIVTTASNNADEEEKCLNLGASDFVSKPYRPNVVLGRAKNIIKLHESVSTLSTIEINEQTSCYTMPAFYHHATACLKQGDSFDLLTAVISDYNVLNYIYESISVIEIIRYFAESFRKIWKSSIIACEGNKLYCLYSAKERLTETEFNEFFAKAIKNSPLPNISIKCGSAFDIDKLTPIHVWCDRVEMMAASIQNDVTKLIAYYNDFFEEKRIREQKMEAEFDFALANDEFVVYYQPKISTTSMKIVAAEALIRWIPQNKKIIAPGNFIPLFERGGLIFHLDEFVFKSVCQFQRRRLDAGLPVVPISVNLSRCSIFYNDILEKYKKIIQDAEIPLYLVPIELTETTTIEYTQIKDLLENFIRAGFSLHMDDFGSGYSSLSNLGSISFDVLKLDKGLVNQIGTNSGNIVIKHSILIAQELGMKVVAEGVEKNAQMDFLRSVGCNMIQGYIFSAPKDKKSFEEMLNNQT